MIGEVIVMEPTAYQAWLQRRRRNRNMAANGQQLFQQLGCATCHRSDTQGRGPNLDGVYGKPVLLEDGRTVMADENYIRESILNPDRKDRVGIQTHHAELPGTGIGREPDGAGGVREIAGTTAKGEPVEQSARRPQNRRTRSKA